MIAEATVLLVLVFSPSDIRVEQWHGDMHSCAIETWNRLAQEPKPIAAFCAPGAKQNNP